jgi:excisionase family DNA binding protein
MGSAEYVPVREAARLLGVGRNTIRKMIRDGTVKAIRLGPRQTRISVASIEALADGDSAA